MEYNNDSKGLLVWNQYCSIDLVYQFEEKTYAAFR